MHQDETCVAVFESGDESVDVGADARIDALTSPVKKQKSLFDFFRRGGK